MTRGLLMTLALIFKIYSPKSPIKNNCTEPRKNIPITIGTKPIENYPSLLILKQNI